MLTKQAVQIYTNKIAMLLKIVSMLINVNWKIIKKTIKLISPIV